MLGALLVVLSANSDSLDLRQNLSECLEDSDYDQLLHTLDEGLPRIRTSNHVIIVGAGMAGLTAAKLLQDAGHKVTMVESSERVGGRVKTYRHEKDGWYADLGAMRIPSFHHILHWFIKKLGVELNPFIMDDPNTFYFIHGILRRTYAVKSNPDILHYQLREDEKGRSADQLLQRALLKMRQEVEAHGCKAAFQKYNHYSLKDYLRREGGVSEEGVQMIGDLLGEESLMHMALIEILYMSIDLNDNIQYDEVKGGSDLLAKAFLNVLNVPIFFNSKVTEVHRSGSGVTVRYDTRHGSSGQSNSVSGDAVLVTTTAKAALFMTFDPPLSVRKMEALRGVHYASSTKVILTFRERFWDRDGIQGGKSITDGPTRFIYYPSHGFPGNDTIGVLLASYTWADDSLLFLGASDEELMDMALRDLANIHGEHVWELCTGVVVKKWSLDPHSLGAFAFFTPYQYLEYSKELFRSEGRVHFAGEHTATPHGWIETAMKSAIRAAAKINKRAIKESLKDGAQDEL
uniref:Amine oxidase n=2 Tax=Gouania willdenowi TaxID=441366 RepID=A0A8C5HJ75_GOUWI